MTKKIWDKYCQEFLGITPQDIRPGCEPKLMEQGHKTEQAIVLIHGLSDSAFYMSAIADKFYDMGFNVVVPLLPAHGLKNSELAQDMMEDSQILLHWKRAVTYAVSEAKKMGNTVSIGGLSLGGALSVYHSLIYPQNISGGIFLFSAALDIGDINEKILRSDVEFIDLFKLIRDKVTAKEKGTLLGKNPYTYSWIPTESLEKLAELIAEIEQFFSNKRVKYNTLQQPVFAAHSEFDKASSIQEIELLMKNHPIKGKKTRLFRIEEKFLVTHARVILSDNVYSLEQEGKPKKPVESKNPFFDDMMQEVQEFVEENFSISSLNL